MYLLRALILALSRNTNIGTLIVRVCFLKRNNKKKVLAVVQ